MPSILALDIASTTGWALFHQGQVISGSTAFKHSRFEGAGMRFIRFRREFLNKFTKVNEVYFEEVRRHEGVDAAHIYGGFTAVLFAWCEENSIPYSGVGVGVIKKFATGKGNANKELMIKAMQGRGYKPTDHNEADALAILEWAREKRAA